MVPWYIVMSRLGDNTIYHILNILPSGRKQIALIVKMYAYPFRYCFHHGSRGQLCLHLDFKVKTVKKI